MKEKAADANGGKPPADSEEAKEAEEKKQKDAKKNQEKIKSSICSRKETSTNNLINYVIDYINKEEKLSMGATGKRKLLSSKEKNRLIKDFLDLRAAPHKNRFYQQKRATMDE